MIKRIKYFFNKYELSFYLSMIGFFIMGTIHMVLTILQFSWLSLNYTLFCYLMLLSRLIIRLLNKKKKTKNIFVISAALLASIIIPLSLTMVITIFNKATPVYLIEYFIYAYALYAFIKITFAIKNLIKYKNENDEERILGWFSLIGALFTLFMLEFSMIRIFGGTDASSLRILELFFQGIIIALVLALIIYFVIKSCKIKREKKIQK